MHPSMEPQPAGDAEHIYFLLRLAIHLEADAALQDSFGGTLRASEPTREKEEKPS
jgi:hypothetical protein